MQQFIGKSHRKLGEKSLEKLEVRLKRKHCRKKFLLTKADFNRWLRGDFYPPKVEKELLKLFPDKEPYILKGLPLSSAYLNKWNRSRINDIRKVYGKTPVKTTNLVYVMEAGLATKIGITNDVDKRVKGVQTGNPMKVHVKALYQLESKKSAKFVEDEILLEFESTRAMGEWMFEPAESVIAVLDEICNSRRGATRII